MVRRTGRDTRAGCLQGAGAGQVRARVLHPRVFEQLGDRRSAVIERLSRVRGSVEIAHQDEGSVAIVAAAPARVVVERRFSVEVVSPELDLIEIASTVLVLFAVEPPRRRVADQQAKRRLADHDRKVPVRLAREAEDLDGFGAQVVGRHVVAREVLPEEVLERTSLDRAQRKLGQNRHGVLPGVGAVAEAVVAESACAAIRRGGDPAVTVEVDAGQATGVVGGGEGEGVLDWKGAGGQVGVGEAPGVPFQPMLAGWDLMIDLVEHQDVGVDLPDDRRRGRELRVAADPGLVDVEDLLGGELADVEERQSDCLG